MWVVIRAEKGWKKLKNAEKAENSRVLLCMCFVKMKGALCYYYFYFEILFIVSSILCAFLNFENTTHAHTELKLLYYFNYYIILISFMKIAEIFFSMFKDFSTFLTKLSKPFLCPVYSFCFVMPLCICSIICSYWFCPTNHLQPNLIDIRGHEH